MERKTIGSFIAALRKSRGMTQQEVAERLNVSNKTISKWERDDGYPEITIIPALAELFEVTSDEILRGKRLPSPDREPEKSAVKTEKQIRRIVNSQIVRFQNFSCLAGALALIGLICLFTTAYAFYRPLIGFGIMLILSTASITVELFLTNAVRISTRDHEIIEENTEMLNPLRKTANRHSFAVYMINMAVIVLSLPFVLIRDRYYVDSVISMGSYLAILPLLLATIALLVTLLLNAFRDKLYLSNPRPVYPVCNLRRMNLVQGFLLFLFPAFALIDRFHPRFSFFNIPCSLVMLAPAMAAMAVPIYKSRIKIERLLLLAAGIRNLLYAFASLYFIGAGLTTGDINGVSFYHFQFKPGPFLVVLGATIAYMLARHYIPDQSPRRERKPL